ncbi:MAG: Na+:solute symporter [Candidatus Omnitrophica bacterium]|nr:Na+:solute symporter [Candidatus Omnitrophota bacterium]
MSNEVLSLHFIDWSIIIGYMVFALAIGFYFSKRASGSLTEYFVAGRTLSWWLAGTSIVATSFAADTPLAIAGIVRVRGLQGNWYWWSGLMGGMLCVFFYARLWRRARLLTDVELVELRYKGKPAAMLRVFHAIYRSTLFNCITMGWVILAMQKLVFVLLGWDKLTSIVVLMILTIIYTVLSGMYGVVATDLIQFVMAMTGSIALAWITLVKLGGPKAMAEKAVAAATEHAAAVDAGQIAEGISRVAAPDQLINFAPNLQATELAWFTFAVFIFVQWWGGGEGGGFLAQRLFSTRNEKDSLLATLWYNFAHYAIRPWPWIIVGLGSLVFFPNLVDPELAYPRMMVEFLPTGLKGLLVASLLAAFMSTMDTHMNWGASYLVNDVYKRFLVKEGSEDHYVFVSRIMIVIMAILAGFTAWQMDSIYNAWLFIQLLMGGTAFVVLLRWYWWRINAWSEISSMIASIVLSLFFDRWSVTNGPDLYPVRLVLVLGGATITWIVTTFLTKPVPADHLERFYRRVRPGGWWGPIAQKARDVEGLHLGWPEVIAWGLGVACVYASLFGLGWLCLGEYTKGLVSMAVCAVTGWFVFKMMGKMDWRGVVAGQRDPDPDEEPAGAKA